MNVPLQEIRRAIEATSPKDWVLIDPQPDGPAEAREATSGNWRILVVFDPENGKFCAGTASLFKQGLIVKLTPDLSELARRSAAEGL